MAAGRYILAGGSGLLGDALARSLTEDGAAVVVLTRSPTAYRGVGRAIAWDGEHVGEWAAELEGAAGVVNLTGRNVNTRWTAAARRDILLSRVASANVIAEAIRRCQTPPPVWVNAGAVGIFGDRGDEVLADDAAPAAPGSDLLADVCRAWEAAVENAELLPGVRRVILRFGVVLSHAGAALPMLVRITRLFAGGRLGSGRQWVPWIHVDDALGAVRWALSSDAAAGAHNTTSPNPVTNAELMRTLRQVLKRPPAPPAPAWAARIGGKVLGIPIEPALASTRAVPRRLQEAGFAFAYPDLLAALRDLP